ncbi:MAG: hypothetical protein AB7P03_18640 [Kofleriaceae bacterium]
MTSSQPTSWGKHAPDPTYLRAVFDITERRIETRWGVPVRIRDVANPFTGDLDGAEIIVDYDVEIEEAVFVLVHLFGHTVQWNCSADARALAFRKGPWDEDHLRALAEYETQACRYSLQLLNEAGFADLDQWISDFAACDGAYLMHYYRTNEKRPFRSFWIDDAPKLAPLAIPPFQPTRWLSRFDGVVI